jgi:O-antigen/teichoic acid export membrane protein
MRHIQSVIRNALWIGLQPILLNIVSLFVIGYIADSLGKEDYGRFVFAFSMVTVFIALCNLGLRAVTVIELATHRENQSPIIGKIFTHRIFLSCLAYLVLLGIVTLMGYPVSTRTVVALAGLTLFFNAAATTCFDVFQAHEKMKYTAYSLLSCGIFVTVFSVVVIYLGFRLIGLTTIYFLGSVILLVTTLFFYRQQSFPKFHIQIDLSFWKAGLTKGVPFFLIGGFFTIHMQAGTILLSKLGTESSVGLYGAAFGLIQRLIVIPDSVCTAIFPTMTRLYSSQREEATPLFERFFQYLILISVPIAVGTTLLSKQIILLVYGSQFVSSALTLGILSWILPMMFLGYLNGNSLGAMSLQNREVKAYCVATPCNIIMSFLLIPRFQENGAAVAILVSYALYFTMTFLSVRKPLAFHLNYPFLLKVGGANLLMGIVVILLRDFNLIGVIIFSGLAYLVALVFFRLVTTKDLDLVKSVFDKRNATPAEASP